MKGRTVLVGGGGGGGGGGRGGGRRGGGGGGLATSDSIALSISGKPDELETGFQLAHLLLTEPKIEEAGFDQYKERTRQFLQESFTNPGMVATRLQTTALYPDNEVRLKPLTVEQLDKLSADKAQTWLNRLIVESPIEVTIVGDLPKEKAIELATRYLGSLPSRPRVDPKMFADVRKVERPKGPRIFEKEIDTPTEQAQVYVGFYGADESNRPDVRAMAMASRILSTRMTKEVREAAQLVYSIGAASRPGSTYPGFGVFTISASVDVAQVDATRQAMLDTVAALVAAPVDADELLRARRPLVESYDNALKTNQGWMNLVERAQTEPERIERFSQAKERLSALTAADVQAMAARYLRPEERLEIVVLPRTAE
jgi:zinc protease